MTDRINSKASSISLDAGLEQDDLFYARVTRTLALLGVAAEAPFGIYHLFVGQWLISAVTLVVILCQTGIFFFVTNARRGVLGAHILAVFHTGGAVAVANLMGFSASYWIFVTTMANYYILPLRSALGFNAISFLLVCPLVLQDAEMGFRFLVCLLLLNLFGYIVSKRTQDQRDVLQGLLFQDPLTQIGNRRAMDEEAEAAQSLFARDGTPSSLLVIDLDFFKRVNDKYGHKMGDDVLKAAVSAVLQRLRVNDRLFRFGGEEFVVIARHTGLDGACVLAEDIRRVVEHSQMPARVCLTTSIGVATLKEKETTDDWFRRADQSMYRAKQCGRNQVCI